MRMRPGFSVTIFQDKFLRALSGVDFTGINVSLGIHGDRIDPVELPCHAAVVADGACQSALFAVMDPDLVVRAVCEEHILLLCVMREGEIVDRSAHAKGGAAGAATFRAARGSRRVHEETGNKLSFLCKHLNSVAAPLTNIDEAVIRDVDAVERGGKLLLIRGRTRFPVIGRRGIIVDLAQGYSVTAPAALVHASIHV